MPGYWLMYNMYALERNGWKYMDRDKRQERIQHLEYDYLAPDSINEILQSIKMLQKFTGAAYFKKEKGGSKFSDKEKIEKGKQLLEDNNEVVNELEIIADCFENSKRKVVIIKALRAYHLFKELVYLYAGKQLLQHCQNDKNISFKNLHKTINEAVDISDWMNIGGQFIPASEINKLIKNVKGNKVKSWDELHNFYLQQGESYTHNKLLHSMWALHEVTGIAIKDFDKKMVSDIFNSSVKTKEWMTKGIYESRAKDYSNPFRKMVYENQKEMDAVLGKLEDNSFINEQKIELENFKQQVSAIRKQLEID